jgi:hypothetical protein
MPRLLLAGSIVLGVFVFAFWFFEAGNFSYENVPGTYDWRRNDQTCVLVLRPNHTFQQQLRSGSTIQNAAGTWRLFPGDSMSHIALSSEFLLLPKQASSREGTVYGHLDNLFGALSITFEPEPDGPVFHKKFFD